MDSHKGLEEALDGLCKDIGIESYVDFLMMVKTAVEALLNSSGGKGRAVDKEHYLFGPILRRSPQAKLIMFMLGFEDIPESDRSMIMLDFDSHVGVMRSFRDFAEKQLSTGRIGQRRVLDTSTSLMADDPYLVVVHLGYFYFLRFLLLSLHTDVQIMANHGVAEQVKVAANAIDLAAKKLNIVQPGGISYGSWQQCKELVFAFVYCEEVRTDDDYLVAAQKMSLGQKMNETANLIANEIRHNFTEEFVDVFVFMHLTKHLIAQTNVGQVLFHSDLGEYVRVSCSLRMDYFTKEFADSVETVRYHCTEALDHSLDGVTVAQLHEQVSWQVHRLLDQLKPQQHRESPVQIGTAQASGSSQVVRYGVQLPTPDQLRTMSPSELNARLPTPDQLATMSPYEVEALQSQLIDLHDTLQHPLAHSMAIARQVGNSNPELLPEEEAVATSRHLVDLLSSTMSETTGNEVEKQDEAEKENKDCDDEECYESKNDKDCLPTLPTAGATVSARSSRDGNAVTKSEANSTHEGLNCQIGKDVEELMLAVNGPMTMQDRSTVHSTVIDTLHQKSLKKKKLASEVHDLQEPLDKNGQIDAIVNALKPVWEEKKKQLAVTEAEIQILELVRQQLHHKKQCRDFDNEIIQNVLCHILESSGGHCYQLLCLVTAVLGGGHSALSEFEVNQLCSHFNIDPTSSDLVSDLMAVLRQRNDLNVEIVET